MDKLSSFSSLGTGVSPLHGGWEGIPSEDRSENFIDLYDYSAS